MLDNDYQKVTSKKGVLTIVFMIVFLLVVLFVVNIYVFEPRVSYQQDLVVKSGATFSQEESEQEFNKIKEDLLENQKFNDLQSFVDNLNLAEFIIGQDKPFIIPEEKK